VGILYAEAALLGAVDEKQPAEGPESLAAERCLRLLLHDRDAPARVHELGGRDEPGKPAADHDGVVLIGHSARQASDARANPR